MRAGELGAGIPDSLKTLALAPWERLEASRSASGSGRGVPTAASIADRHGAQLELADAGPGLDARLLFPGAADSHG
ncbi:hypothetical protein [Phenylobacterium sp.]|uniref:hypothetical protein n=1 Tax=Phenylobacterium sp. TaxID=1871053 RepID=UPI00121D87EB|nr:hypothetical protein [Phenylobacterium sp.]THD65929.1 MAG: hypothetical protein E8A12_06685 [Phenylobacterium sp.]